MYGKLPDRQPYAADKTEIALPRAGATHVAQFAHNTGCDLPNGLALLQ